MSNTVIVVRHAKSSWVDSGLGDHDRPLNKRGFRDAPRMGVRLSNLGYHPQLAVSSSALRARTTAGLIGAETGLDIGDIKLDPDLYGAMPGELLYAIASLEDHIDCAMIVAHNPSVTELVNYLTGAEIINIPTCGVAVMSTRGKGWQGFNGDAVELLHYDYPRSEAD
jgi:phosphohistidine phosphatase